MLFEAMTEHRVEAGRGRTTSKHADSLARRWVLFSWFSNMQLSTSLPGTHCEIQHDGDSAASMQHPAGHAAGWIQEFAGHDPITLDGLPILAMWIQYGNLCMKDSALGICIDSLVLGIISAVSSRSCTAMGGAAYAFVPGAACKEN